MRKDTIMNTIIIVAIAIAIIIVGRYLGFFAIFPNQIYYSVGAFEGENFVLSMPYLSPTNNIIDNSISLSEKRTHLGLNSPIFDFQHESYVDTWARLFFNSYLEGNIKISINKNKLVKGVGYVTIFGVCDAGLNDNDRNKLSALGMKHSIFRFYDYSYGAGCTTTGDCSMEAQELIAFKDDCTSSDPLQIDVWERNFGSCGMQFSCALSKANLKSGSNCTVEGIKTDGSIFKQYGEIDFDTQKLMCSISPTEDIQAQPDSLKTTFYMFKQLQAPISYIAPTQEQPISQPTQPITPPPTNETQITGEAPPEVNILGIVLGIIIFIVVIGALIFLLFKMKKR